MPSPLRTRRFVLNIAAMQFTATIFLAAYLVAMGRLYDDHDAVWGRAAILAGAASQATLLMTWLTLGDASPARQAVYGAASALGMLLAYRLLTVLGPSLSIVWPYDDLGTATTAALGPTLIAAAAFVVLARRGGWRWRDEHAASGPSVRFSLRTMLLVTVGASLLLAGCRWLHTDFAVFVRLAPWFTPHAWGELLFGAGLALSCIAAVAACLGPRPHLPFVIGALAAGVGCGFASGWATEALHHGRSTGAAAAGGMLAAIATMSSLLVLRSVGWRIDRAPLAPQATPPSDHG